MLTSVSNRLVIHALVCAGVSTAVLFPSSSAAPAASITSPPPSGNPAIVSRKPGIFVGIWVGHGRQLVIRSDGSATASYRIYVFCSEHPAPPCDGSIGNAIIDGGRVKLHIEKVITAHHMSTATAQVTKSSDPQFRAGSRQELVLNGDVITWAGLGTFCDTRALAKGVCGA